MDPLKMVRMSVYSKRLTLTDYLGLLHMERWPTLVLSRCLMESDQSYHIIKKKLGKPPTIFIAAEIDPVLRRLVAAEIGLREDQQWGYTVEGCCYHLC